MPFGIPKSVGLVALAFMGALYGIKWERQTTASEYTSRLVELLDDERHPRSNNTFRGRGERLSKMLVTLHEASAAGLHQDKVVLQAATELGMPDAYAKLLADRLIKNTKTALGMGLLSDESLPALAMGQLPDISQGAYAGGEVDWEFVVPIEAAPELEGHFANLMLRPVLLTEELGLPVDDQCYRTAGDFYKASVISENSYVRVGARYDEHLRR